jgi:hypothetical protein
MHIKGNMYRFLLGLLLLFIIILLLTSLIPGGFILVIKPVYEKEPVFVAPVKPAEYFTLHYVHSVNGLPVWEKHHIDEKGIIYIEEERFLAFGAGMGHWKGHGTLIDSGKYQIIKDIHKPVGNFILRVANSKQKHTLILSEHAINLSEIAAGKAVSVSVEKVSLFEKLVKVPFE